MSLKRETLSLQEDNNNPALVIIQPFKRFLDSKAKRNLVGYNYNKAKFLGLYGVIGQK